MSRKTNHRRNVLKQYGTIQCISTGITVAAGLTGQTGSSTRLELLGAIVAITHDGPCHVGVDNSACLKIVNELINLAGALHQHHKSDSTVAQRLMRKLCTGNLRKP